MTIYVTIERVARADQQILVDVLYRDDKAGMKVPRVLQFPPDVTAEDVLATAIKLGSEFAKAEDTISKVLVSLVDQTYDVETGERADVPAFDLGPGRVEEVADPAFIPVRG